jgi:hypothetical protein
MDVQIYAVTRGVYRFKHVTAMWSDGVMLRVQHHGSLISVLPLQTVREIERVEEVSEEGWTYRRLDRVPRYPDTEKD